MEKERFNPNIQDHFCGTCGEKLEWCVLHKYYTTDTGEPYYHYHFWCPRWRFWHGIIGKHANWKCDQDGSTYSYEA